MIYGDVTQTDNTRAPEDTLAEGHCRLSAHRTATFPSALMKKNKNHIVSLQTSKDFLNKKSQQGSNEEKPCDYITVLIHVE